MKTMLLVLGGVLCLSCAAPRNSARSIGDVDPLPPLPDCVSVDSTVPVLKTASGLEYVRTPESAFDATRAALFVPPDENPSFLPQSVVVDCKAVARRKEA